MGDGKKSRGTAAGNLLATAAIATAIGVSVYARSEHAAEEKARPRDPLTECIETLTAPPSAVDEATRRMSRSVGDDARDLAVDLMLSICTKADRQRNVRAVYFSSLTNEVIDALRKRMVEADYQARAAIPFPGSGPTLQALVLSCPAPAADPLEQVLSVEMQTILSAWILELPAQDREVLSMRVRGLTFKQIAEQTGTKLSTVYDRWRRLEQPLRARLQACDL